MLNLARINARMATLTGWSLELDSIVKDFEFASFGEAILFVNTVAALSDKHQHHPRMIINYTRVHLQLTTHEEKGLSDKDFDLAAAIDAESRK